MKNVKRLSYCLFMFMLLFMVVSPVFAVNANGCKDVADIDIKITNAVHLIVLVIQIVIPVLLVIFGSVDFLKAVVAQKEDEIKKGQQTFIKRLIAAIIVFFVVAIVRLVVSFATSDDSNDKQTILSCFNCFINGAADNGSCNK